jgi:hypothetical protein
VSPLLLALALALIAGGTALVSMAGRLNRTFPPNRATKVWGYSRSSVTMVGLILVLSSFVVAGEGSGLHGLPFWVFEVCLVVGSCTAWLGARIARRGWTTVEAWLASRTRRIPPAPILGASAFFTVTALAVCIAGALIVTFSA